VPDPGDYDDGEIGGMIGRGNRSTRRKPAPMPLCPLQTPRAARTRTRAAAVGSQRLTACATARPLRRKGKYRYSSMHIYLRHFWLKNIYKKPRFLKFTYGQTHKVCKLHKYKGAEKKENVEKRCLLHHEAALFLKYFLLFLVFAFLSSASRLYDFMFSLQKKRFPGKSALSIKKGCPK
jgi:hypothetical protein